MRMPLGLRLKQFAGKHIPFLKMGPTIDRSKIFSLRPIRHQAIEWETNNEGEAVLQVPHRKDKLGKTVSYWFRLPESRAVQLDEVGTFVWNLCDGSSTVESIILQTSKKYKMNRREVEISVTTYLQMLAERHFIGFFQRGGKTT